MKKEQPKSLRNAFIRISAINNTEKGIVSYSSTDLLIILRSWLSIKNFFLVEHVPEVNEDNRHYHIVIQFNNPVPFLNIKAKFPYGKIEVPRNVGQCVKYLIHAEDQTKTQYDKSAIITNNPQALEKHLKPSPSSRRKEVDRYLLAIMSGEIREFEICEKVPPLIFAQYRSRIDNAITYFINNRYMDKNRAIRVVFIYGATGVGKTTLAKKSCEEQNKSYCISSSSNDPMQDYKCEDVLILDDLRDTDYKLNDLLKLLDNHTKSTSKARFRNKAFVGDTIIITSAVPLAEWYFDEKAEDKHQLKRRIGEYVKMSKEKIDSYMYDPKTKRHEFFVTSPNLISQYYNDPSKTVISILEGLGNSFSPKVKEKLQEELEQVPPSDMFKDM